MHGLIADFLDQFDLGKQVTGRNQFLETGLMDQGGQIILIGNVQAAIVRIEPFDGFL